MTTTALPHQPLRSSKEVLRGAGMLSILIKNNKAGALEIYEK